MSSIVQRESSIYSDNKNRKLTNELINYTDNYNY